MTHLTRSDLEARDAADPLADFRGRFLLPEGVVYLDGNSLGALPAATPGRLEEVVRREWGEGLIRSWNRHGWIDLPQAVGDRIAPLIGARPGEVVVADSTSVNLFKLLAAALKLRPDRRVILSERDNFPTDLYVAQGLVDLLGGRAELRRVDREELPAALDSGVAVAMLTQVDFRTGRLHDLAAVTAAAHACGALVLWDLAHSAGAVPVDLSGCGADLAVGCGYKFLNGGPGAPAFAYARRDLHPHLGQPLWGWMGHRAPFAFDPDYAPAPDLRRLLCGTPVVLGLAALEVGVDLVTRAGIPALRRKSVELGETLIALVEQECAGHGFALASPRAAAERGSQVSFRHPAAYPIVQALIRRGVIGDFREPDIVRFGLAPLYLRFVDLWDAAAALRQVMAGGEWRDPALTARARVT